MLVLLSLEELFALELLLALLFALTLALLEASVERRAGRG